VILITYCSTLVYPADKQYWANVGAILCTILGQYWAQYCPNVGSATQLQYWPILLTNIGPMLAIILDRYW